MTSDHFRSFRSKMGTLKNAKAENKVSCRKIDDLPDLRRAINMLVGIARDRKLLAKILQDLE